MLCPFYIPFVQLYFLKLTVACPIATELKLSKISFDGNHFLSLKITVHALKFENTPKCLFLLVNMHQITHNVFFTILELDYCQNNTH